MPKVRMTFHVPESLRGRIVDEAEGREQSLSEFARKVFETYFSAVDARFPPPKEVKKR